MGRKPGSKNRPKSYDVATVRAAGAGRWPEILAALTGLPRETFDGRHQPCPKCGGTDRFRAFDDDSGGGICNQCWTTKNGDGISFVQWHFGESFPAALQRVAAYLGFQPSANGSHKAAPADPAAHLEFREWFTGDEMAMAAGLLAAKPGISFAAIKECGGRPATYRGQYHVVALPIYGPELTAAEPVGWCLYNRTGGPLPKFGKDKSVEWVKVKITHGSKPGLIGQVAALAADRSAPADPNDAEPNGPTIWKCEGPTDVLAAVTSYRELPDNYPTNCPAHLFITNANGAGERPAAWMASILAGRRVRVIHDADKPGQDGAERWSTAIAATAAECRNVRLPYPLVPDHGPDLRDYFAKDGHTFADLLALAESAAPIAPPSAVAAEAATAGDVEEDDRDPHRLARIFLESINALPDGRLALRYWHNEFWGWDGRRYRPIPDKELPAMVNACCKREFDRLARLPAKDDEPRRPIMVSRAFVNNVIAALEAICLLPATVEANSWLGGDVGGETAKKLWLSMENGILRLDDLLADADDVMQPHSPLWFSPVSLPYEFVPGATCPRFLDVLARNLDGDAERIAVLQEWAGYILTPSTDQQKFLVLEGDGANGKTVYLAALQAMIGPENTSNVALELFDDRFALTDTLGKLLNVSGDTSEIEKAAEGKLKAFVSGDRLFFDRKGIGGINASPTARLVVAANNRPRFSDRSSGIWRRMLLVPWTRIVSAEERIVGLDKPEHWVASGELPGVFWWAVLGLARLREQGAFTESAVGNEALNDYKADTNPTRVFLIEHYEAAGNADTESRAIYKHYRDWCIESGHKPFSDRTFGKEVKRVFPESEKTKARTGFGTEWVNRGIRKR